MLSVSVVLSEELSETLSETMKKEKRSKILKNDYNEFYDYLIETFE